MTPHETIRDLKASGIPHDEAVRLAREEFDRQRATSRESRQERAERNPAPPYWVK